MALAAHQLITNALSGKPFGDGRDGALTVSVSATQSNTVESCSGSSGGTTLTAAGSTLSNDDVILIHQSRGTGVGTWEINRIASGGGTVNLVTAKNLANTYTDSGASQAQAIKIPMYTDVTVNGSVIWTAPAWDADTEGILLFAATGTVTITGTITGNGIDGVDLTANGETGNQGGYRGGQSHEGSNAEQGEGTSGDRGTVSTAANGNGGGGSTSTGEGGGGGGGNGTAGSTGSSGGPGTGGGTSGAAELTTITSGGAGGGGGGGGGTEQGSGANGGGIVFAFANDFATPNSITLNGGTGGQGDTRNGGGGGAGGSFILECKTATLGSSAITATAGSGTHDGGNGGAGRIAIHYGLSFTGTTNPTIDSSLNTLLKTGDPTGMMTVGVGH